MDQLNGAYSPVSFSPLLQTLSSPLLQQTTPHWHQVMRSSLSCHHQRCPSGHAQRALSAVPWFWWAHCRGGLFDWLFLSASLLPHRVSPPPWKHHQQTSYKDCHCCMINNGRAISVEQWWSLLELSCCSCSSITDAFILCVSNFCTWLHSGDAKQL